ncbi:MAG: hypothetical protein AAFY02_18245 [Pseudomonadota bacterium]
MSRGGLLIWNDCAAEALADYERWYEEEHLPERVGLPGYRSGARYEALAGTAPRFFTLYETASPEVFLSPAYLSKLAKPTPWTQAIMPNFTGMSRTVCRQVGSRGRSVAGALVTLPEVSPEPLDEEVLGWSLWQAAGPPPTPTAEMALRSGADGTVASCLLLHLARPEEAQALAARHSSAGAYRLLSLLRHEEVAT